MSQQIDWSKIMPSYEDMLIAGMHYGRKKTVRHPKMEPYIYALRDTIHIINVFKTEEKLKEAIEFLKKIKDSGGMILWVSLTKASEEGIIDIARSFDMPYIKERWLGGTLTNFKTMKQRVDYYKEMKAKYENEEYMKNLTKKERFDFEKEFRVLKMKFEGTEKLDRIPDVLFLTSLREGLLPVKEARRVGVKTVAICNTESDPTLVDYPIPANDNARQSVQMILSIIKKALER